MHRKRNLLILAAVLTLAACEQSEYSDERAVEPETNPPPVGSTAIDSAAAGARVDTLDSLDDDPPQGMEPQGGQRQP